MSIGRNVRRVYATAVVLAGLCLALSASASEEPQKDKDEKKGKVVDLSKLPPDVAKKIEELIESGKEKKEKEKEKGGKKGFGGKDFEKKFGKKDFFGKKEGKKDADEKKAPEGKTLTLVQAIGVVEKLSNGHATKAEQHGEGSKAHFVIEIADSLGNRRVELSSTGEVIKHGEGAGRAWGFGWGGFKKGEFNKGEFFKKGKKGFGE